MQYLFNKYCMNMGPKYKNISDSMELISFIMTLFILSTDFCQFLLIPFASVHAALFILRTIHQLSDKDLSFNHKASSVFVSLMLISAIVLYANLFSVTAYLASPVMMVIPSFLFLSPMPGFLNVDDDSFLGETILLGTFKLENWHKFFFAFLVQFVFVICLVMWSKPALILCMFAWPSIQYAACVFLLVPFVFVQTSFEEINFRAVPLLIARDKGLMTKIVCCVVFSLLFALGHLPYFPPNLLGFIHCLAVFLPWSIATLVITFYSNGTEYSSGFHYGNNLCLFLLFTFDPINASLAASVPLSQICLDFLKESVQLLVPVVFILVYENYNTGEVETDQYKDSDDPLEVETDQPKVAADSLKVMNNQENTLIMDSFTILTKKMAMLVMR